MFLLQLYEKYFLFDPEKASPGLIGIVHKSVSGFSSCL